MLPNIYQHVCICAKYLFLTMDCILSASKGSYLDFHWGGRPANQTDRRTNSRTDGRTDRRIDGRTDPLIELRVATKRLLPRLLLERQANPTDRRTDGLTD